LRGRPAPGDLWSKFRDEDEADGPAWHPLIDHSADVALVLEAMLRRPVIRRRLARAGGLSDLDDGLIARLGFLAFLHDLGKCALGFRAKAVPEFGQAFGHLAALRPLWLQGPLVEELERLIVDLDLAAWGESALVEHFLAVFAHHGRLPELTYRPGEHWSLERGWTGREREPLKRLEELAAAGRAIFPEAFEDGAEVLPQSPAFVHLFAGLLMLADWLGSSEERFPFAEPTDPPRAAFVRDRAPEVLATIGFAPPPITPPLPAFEAQFRFPPRPAQAAMEVLALPGDSGSVVLLESETGSGKTEAALRWASRLIEAGQVDGCFFAVPLRSAAVQLHGRMQRWLKATYGHEAPEALLAVPGYYRMGEAEGTKRRPGEVERLPKFAVQWTDDEVADRRLERWAAEQPKRYAAASFAVGTIDQALLGALAVKHAHLRAACLVRHLLVIDEVHASDIYMTTLAERLMALFRAAGGHVLLMSATVGAGTRERLVKGRKRPPPFEEAVAVAYPRITAGHAEAVAVTREQMAEKEVMIESAPLMDEPERVAARAVAAVEAGARVLVLRNTVASAIATQQALEALLPSNHEAFFRIDGVVTLHHGRFAAEDRKLLDEAVEARFGKKSPASPAVVVATQTLEQSLDVDADLLITDLCPIDVLLQRIGRLHRHERTRPSGFEQARCVVLVPGEGDLASFLRGARHGLGRERAYENVLAVEATRRMVAESPAWSIPRDNRRLVEEGTHEGRLQALAGELGEAWLDYWKGYAGSEGAARGQARDVSIDFARPFGELRWPEAAERLATRIGAADLILPVEPAIASPFGARHTHLKIPAWMTATPMSEDEPTLVANQDGTLSLGEARYRYDRFGLQKA